MLSDFPLINTLHTGDSIYSVNGYRVNTEADFVSLIRAVSPGSHIELFYITNTTPPSSFKVSTHTMALNMAPANSAPTASTDSLSNQFWQEVFKFDKNNAINVGLFENLPVPKEEKLRRRQLVQEYETARKIGSSSEIADTMKAIGEFDKAIVQKYHF